MVVSGDGRGEHQENPTDKEEEVLLSTSQPIQIISSQKDTVLNMEINTSQIVSSQKNIIIERVPN